MAENKHPCVMGDMDRNKFEGSSVEKDSVKLKKYRSMPISKIARELSNAVGASYRSLPRGYPQPICSGRSPIEDVSINSYWVSTYAGAGFELRTPSEDERKLVQA